MFLLRNPSPDRIRRFLREQRQAPLSYSQVGASRADTPPPGYAANRGSACLGSGLDAFHRGVDAMRRWAMYDLPWIRILPAAPPIRTGETVGLLVRHYAFQSLNACRIVYTVDEQRGTRRRWGFAYGTLPEHGERGEELFTVELREDGSVWYELFSFSRPGQPLSWIGYPFAHALQLRFARESPRAMRRAVEGHGTPTG